jgi:hypothetical protein
VPLALDFFKIAHDQKSYNLVHCWRDLKDYNNWKLTYAAYRRSFKNGGGNASVAVNPKEEDGNQGALLAVQGARMPPREFMAATLFVKMPLIGTPSAE